MEPGPELRKAWSQRISRCEDMLHTAREQLTDAEQALEVAIESARRQGIFVD